MFKRELVNWRRQIGKGFTLIEIVIVITILGIIIAIAIPRFIANDRSDMNPLQQMNKNNAIQYEEGSKMEPGVYQIWVEECNKFITITVSDVGG